MAVRRAIGPILTTGVALATAGIVVANPIIAPRADVQIPAVQLSGNNDSMSMLDEDFLDAIAPAPPESTNPFSVLKQLISSIAADATYLGKNAIVDAFVAGVNAVSQPELTATASPYVERPAMLPADLPVLADLINLPDIDPAFVVPPSVDLALNLPTPAAISSAAPVVQEFVATLAADAGYVGGEMIAAAFAAGAVVAAEPAMIVATLKALVRGDISGALQNAVRVVTAPLGPPTIVLDALKTVVVNQLNRLGGFGPASAAESASAPVRPSDPADDTTSAPDPAGPDSGAVSPLGRDRDGQSGSNDPGDTTADLGASGPAVKALSSSGLRGGNRLSPRAAVPAVVDAVGDAVTAVRESADAATEAVGDAARAITGNRIRSGQPAASAAADSTADTGADADAS